MTGIMHVVLVTGTRPQIIKSAPLLEALEIEGVPCSFIHTGQHYDFELAVQLFDELNLQEPDKNLEVGSGTGVYQISEIMVRLHDEIGRKKIDYLIVPGDTNSALGAALTGFKLDIPTCHLESGLRSHDMYMQEEINRILIDHGSAGLFAPTKVAVENLKNENVSGQVFHTGDTMYDILKKRLPKFTSTEFKEKILSELCITEPPFAVLTLHRRENVDIRSRLENIIRDLGKLEFQIIFPIHPRTQKQLDEWQINLSKNIHVIKPISYDKMMGLVSQASLLLTDSGGLQKEAYLLNTPCVTIRDNSEWVETIEAGANVLTPVIPEKIVEASLSMWAKKLNNDPSVYGDGKAAFRIAKIIASGEIHIKSEVVRN
jgi:UDP-GlcNAc3NAcA epimerase